MPRTKDASRYADLAKDQVLEAYFLVRDELKAKTDVLDGLQGEVDELQRRFGNLYKAATSLGVDDSEL